MEIVDVEIDDDTIRGLSKKELINVVKFFREMYRLQSEIVVAHTIERMTGLKYKA